MRAGALVIVDVRGQDAAQMALVEDHDMIQTLATNRTDPALDVSVVQSCRMQMMRLMRLEFGFGLLIRFIRFATNHSVS